MCLFPLDMLSNKSYYKLKDMLMLSCSSMFTSEYIFLNMGMIDFLSKCVYVCVCMCVYE